MPLDFNVHLIFDNLKTRRTRLIHDRMAKRPRFHLHFTPISASWLNLVECWFAFLTRQHLERGAFSTAGPEAAILACITEANTDPKPVVWTKSADDILAGIACPCQRTSISAHQAGRQMSVRSGVQYPRNVVLQPEGTGRIG